MAKIDLRKQLKELYAPKAQPVMVEVAAMRFVMIDGEGDPSTSEAFQDAMGCLYGVSYTLKFMLKAEGHDWVVMPSEGLWWSDDMEDFATGNKDGWQWTLMIVQPEVVTDGHFAAAVEQLREKKDPPGLDRLRFEAFDEGLAAQVMHTGSYSDEGPTIEALHAFIAEQGKERRGKHHEIYLSDPRRTAPEKLKTIVRQPVS